MSGLRELAAALAADGGLLAAALREPPAGGSTVAVEAVREGYLLHFGAPRLVGGDDDDLLLLAGDRCYALGLERLAAAGDLDGIAVLADLISECARAHAEGDPEAAGAAWERAEARLAG